MEPYRVSTRLIENALKDKWIKPLALYHLLKVKYKNSCVYDYKSRMSEIANFAGISERTLYTYISILKTQNLANDHNINLVLKSVRLAQKKRKEIILLQENASLNEIVCLLCAKKLEKEGRKQAYMESIRRYAADDQFISVHGENLFAPSFSIRTIAKILSLSKNKAEAVVKVLNEMGVIESMKQKPRLISTKDGPFIPYMPEQNVYRFAIGNKLFEQYGCTHNFLHFPIYLKKPSKKAILKNHSLLQKK